MQPPLSAVRLSGRSVSRCGAYDLMDFIGFPLAFRWRSSGLAVVSSYEASAEDFAKVAASFRTLSFLRSVSADTK